jgi:hypothetical protein
MLHLHDKLRMAPFNAIKVRGLKQSPRGGKAFKLSEEPVAFITGKCDEGRTGIVKLEPSLWARSALIAPVFRSRSVPTTKVDSVKHLVFSQACCDRSGRVPLLDVLRLLTGPTRS